MLEVNWGLICRKALSQKKIRELYWFLEGNE